MSATAARLATPEQTCWQCGASAQRSKDAIGACGRHLLPLRAERQAMVAALGKHAVSSVKTASVVKSVAPAPIRPVPAPLAVLRQITARNVAAGHPVYVEVKPTPVKAPVVKAKRGRGGLSCATCKAKLGHRDNCAAAAHTRAVLLETARTWATTPERLDHSWIPAMLPVPHKKGDTCDGRVHPLSNGCIQFGPNTVFPDQAVKA